MKWHLSVQLLKKTKFYALLNEQFAQIESTLLQHHCHPGLKQIKNWPWFNSFLFYLCFKYCFQIFKKWHFFIPSHKTLIWRSSGISALRYLAITWNQIDFLAYHRKSKPHLSKRETGSWYTTHGNLYFGSANGVSKYYR